jgi:hypothetical protein
MSFVSCVSSAAKAKAGTLDNAAAMLAAKYELIIFMDHFLKTKSETIR